MLRFKARRLTASRGTITLRVVGARAAADSIADKIRTTVAKIEETSATRDKTPAQMVINHSSTEIAPTKCTPKSLRTVDSGPTVAETAPEARAVAVVTVVAEAEAATRIVVVAVAVAMVVGSTTNRAVGCALISSREHLRGSRVPRCLKKTFSTPTRRLSSSMRTRWLSLNANVNMCAST